MRPKRHRIPPLQAERASHLRRNATFPEGLLRSRLRAGRLAGLKFRRQAPVGPFIVDFYCADKSLVVELDGLSHDDTQAYDRDRTQFLEGHGLRVMRYTNDDVLADVDAVAMDIARQAGV